MHEKDGKYKFSWDFIGDIELGRPNLGNMTRLEIYRLMQFTFRDVTEKVVGSEMTDKIFYEAGKLAGTEFYKHFMGSVKELPDFISQLQELMEDLGIGILRIEQLDMDKGELLLTVSEDLDCSGLPEMGDEICTYDEGFICALLECFTGVPFLVKEIDCWCTGDRTCRFRAKAIQRSKNEDINYE